MPSTHTQAQKSAIAQFISCTQARENVAVKFLRSQGWNVSRAVDSFFSSSQTSSQAVTQRAQQHLNALFDNYTEEETGKDTMTVETAMRYLDDLSISIDEPLVFTVHADLLAPTIGEITRQGFLDGWLASAGPATDIASQRAHMAALRSELQLVSSETCRRTYKAAFVLLKPAGSKVVPLESAIGCWETVFGSRQKGGTGWSSTDKAWLEEWCTFLREKWNRAVNRDLWDQTLLFVRKIEQDDSLAWWSEEGSWPGVVDEFVANVRLKGWLNVKP